MEFQCEPENTGASPKGKENVVTIARSVTKFSVHLPLRPDRAQRGGGIQFIPDASTLRRSA